MIEIKYRFQLILVTLLLTLAVPFCACGADGQIKISETPSMTFPIIIDRSGSYVLTSNIILRSMPGDTVINIDADNVTLDFNGHSLIGEPRGGHGIVVHGSNVQIRNGSVQRFTHAIAVMNQDSEPKGVQIINMRVVNNATGVRFFHAIDGQVRNCTVAYNTNVGIYVERGGGIITGSSVYGNEYGGILTGSVNGFGSVIIKDNNVYNNGGWFGIEAHSSTITGNNVYNNKKDGIIAHGSSMVSGNNVYNNQQNGIKIDSGILKGNTVIGNNQSDSMAAGGIWVGSSTLVQGNSLQGNLQNNIIVTGGKNALENNLVTDSANGINFSGAPNFYTNNRASGNTTSFTGNVPTGDADGGGNVSF